MSFLSSRLLACAGLVFLAWTGCSAQSTELEITPTSVVAGSSTSAIVAINNVASTGTGNLDNSAPSPSMMTPSAHLSASLSPSAVGLVSARSPGLGLLSSLSPSSSFSSLASEPLILSPPLSPSPTQTAVFSSEVVGIGSLALPSVSALHTSSGDFFLFQSTAQVLESLSLSETGISELSASSAPPPTIETSASLLLQSLNASKATDLQSDFLSSSATQHLLPFSESSDAVGTSTTQISSQTVVPPMRPGAGKISPSTTSSVPTPSSASTTTPSKHQGVHGELHEEENVREIIHNKHHHEGGDSGMNSGEKAAVGIFVSLAVIGIITAGVVLYRKNYLTPRSFKSMVKGGVRYQTQTDTMSYNDEGMLILPDHR